MPITDKPPTIIALLHGPDQPGLVARVSSWIFERGGNILHADMHRDAEAGVFFQRVEWIPPGNDPAADADAFREMGENLGMSVKTALSGESPRIVVFVSKIDHCFHDIILRWKAGELQGDIVAVFSNHSELAEATKGYGLPFHHIPVSGSKPEVEAEQLGLLRECRPELIVLARYMQILSKNFLHRAGCPIINIHHSFLPAFAGARPYHLAYERGVKIIGATAHYVTAQLDEGPIIQQEVTHVTHRNSVADLERKGRDLEKIVLAQAVRWHLEYRLLIYNNKTVVFD